MGIHSNQVDCIYPMPMFRAEASKILKIHNGLTESDLNIILTYLARDQSKIVYDAEVCWSHLTSVQSELAIRSSSLR